VAKQAKNRAGKNGNVPPAHARFKPGQSGNPNGRPRETSLTAIIRRVLAEADEEHGTKGEKLIAVALRAADKGDFRYFKELIERNDGKVPDRIADADGNKLIVEVQYVDAPRSTDTE
jgi:hypothetical protein